jgi:hypothetical protein
VQDSGTTNFFGQGDIDVTGNPLLQSLATICKISAALGEEIIRVVNCSYHPECSYDAIVAEPFMEN